MNIIEHYKRSFSGLSKDVWFVALIYLINRCGEMVMPFMSIYLTSQLGFTKTESSIVLFCFGVGALIGSNIGGFLTDSIGNFKVMAISLAGTGVGFLGFLLFKSLLLLSVWMMVTAIMSSMFSPAAFSAVGLWGIPENKTRGYSLLRMAINLGMAIGPMIGGFLAYAVGYEWLFVVDGVTCFLALITLYAVLQHRKGINKQSQNVEQSKQSPYRDPKLVMLLVFNLIAMVAFFQILFVVPVYFKEELLLDEWMIGMFFTANGLLVFLFEMPIVYAIELRKKFFNPIILGAALIGAAYFSFIVFAIPIIAIMAYSLLIAIGEIVNFPLIPSLAMRRSNEHNQGKYMGAVTMMFAMAFTLAPICGLPVVDLIGYTNYWYVAGGMSTFSAFMLYLLKMKYAK